MARALVITPTFNESENVRQLIDEVLKQDSSLEILIVDDNSPDGTAKIVQEIQKTNSRVHLLERPKKMGLGTAYVAGFKYAIANSFDFMIEMDADFSHSPAELPNYLRLMNDYDLVIGSRYINGVRIMNWPIRRLILSYSANVYTRIITGLPIKDATGGFKCFKRKVLESINLDDVHSNGYAFQIEMNFKAWRKKFRLYEHPIIFMDRTLGQSKMSKHIIYEAIWMVWRLKLQAILGKI